MTISAYFHFLNRRSGSSGPFALVVFRNFASFIDAFENNNFNSANISSMKVCNERGSQNANSFNSEMYTILSEFNNGGCAGGILHNGFEIKPVFELGSINGESITQETWNNQVLNKHFKVDFYELLPSGQAGIPLKYCTFDCVFGSTIPNLYNQPLMPLENYSETACNIVDYDARREHWEDNSIDYNQLYTLQSFVNGQIYTETDCTDKRTSTDAQQIRFIVSDGLQNVSDFTISLNISDGSTQEFGINTYMNDTAYNTFINMYNLNQNVFARCMFVGGNIRPSCTVRLVAKVYGESLGVGTSLTPPYVDLDFNPLLGTDVDILRAQFDPCNDKPVRIQEDLTAFINGLKANVPTIGFSLYQVIPYKVIVSGLTDRLVDYCCDDSTQIDDDSIEYTSFIEPILQGYGGTGSGGGDDVDLTCICEGLTRLNNSLIAFKEANQGALASIDEAIQNISIEGGGSSSCICDNLENISDGVIAIKEAIDDKNLSVVNNNTVQPPVNNISVQPPINNISLPTTELENIANNTRALNCVCSSLQNLEVIEQGTKESIDGVKNNLQCTKDDNIACIVSDIDSNINNIANSLVCGSDSIACVLQSKNISVDVDLNSTDVTNGLESIAEKLDDINTNVHDGLINSDDESNLQNISESLNTSDDESKSLADVLSDSLNTSDDESKSLADVVKDKEMGTNIDVEVSPADDVNINRVYYTNQRNGDTNI